MKITKVEVFRVDTGDKMNHPIGCRIWCDNGLFGDGEAGMAYGTGGTGAWGILCDYAKRIVGLDPLRTEYIWNMLYKSTFWGQNGGPVTFSGISAIDIALWDIKGKYFGVPCYQLLGGKIHDKLRTYASQLQFGWGYRGEPDHKEVVTLDDYYNNCRIAVDEGFDAIKVDFFDRDETGKPLDTYQQTGLIKGSMLKLLEDRIRTCREAVGPEVDIIMENHSYPDANGAVQLAKIAEKYNIYAFEEPNTPNIATSEYIAAHTDIALANGERLFGRFEYAPYFSRGLIQLAQPDVCNCGGVSEIKKIADMGYAYDVGMQVHVCGSPLATNVALHIECTLPNFIIHEHHTCNRKESSFKMTKYNLQPEDGMFDIPEDPGFGNEWLQSAIDTACEYRCIDEGGSPSRM